MAQPGDVAEEVGGSLDLQRRKELNRIKKRYGLRVSEEMFMNVIWKQRRFFVDNLMLDVQLANILTRCSSHPQGKSEIRCENDQSI